MAAIVDSPVRGYRAGQQPTPRGRVIALLAVLALHGVGLAALLAIEPAPTPVAPVVLQARLIEEAPVIAVPPPPPPAPVRPKAAAKRIATPRPSPILAPPPEPEAEPVELAEVAPPAPPAPPAAPAPAAEPVVVPPSFVAAYLNNPAPRYPQAAKLRRETGEVRLRVRVMADGSAGDVQIEQSSGSASLDSAARDIVFRRWRFVPARRGDEPIEAWVIVPIVFELKP
jgi:protein TonB